MAKTTHAGRRDPELWDRMINSQFDGQQPVLSGDESMIAARKLYRHALGKAFPGKVVLTSGNRYTWVYRERVVGKVVRVLRVNPDKREGHTRGLRSLIHDMSHYCHRQLHPSDSAHSIRQARLEARLVKFALERKWHEGALKRDPTPEVAKAKPDKVVQRYRAMVNRRDKWADALEQAERLHAKAVREVKEYERRHGARLQEAGR